MCELPVVSQPNTFVLIWTTTPWTLPANLAIAYNKNFQYVQVTVGAENYILSRGLLPAVAEKCGWTDYKEQPFAIEKLASLEYQHPFIPARKRQGVPRTDFVTSRHQHQKLRPYRPQSQHGRLLCLGASVGLPIYSPVRREQQADAY